MAGRIFFIDLKGIIPIILLAVREASPIHMGGQRQASRRPSGLAPASAACGRDPAPVRDMLEHFTFEVLSYDKMLWPCETQCGKAREIGAGLDCPAAPISTRNCATWPQPQAPEWVNL